MLSALLYLRETKPSDLLWHTLTIDGVAVSQGNRTLSQPETDEKIGLTARQVIDRRNSEIDAIRGMLYQALADYNNPQLLENLSAPAQLRRQECVWSIEQAIINTYQMQGELSAVTEHLLKLQTNIRTDSVRTISACANQDELNFLAPEISRIHDCDLFLLESWQQQTDWMRSLSSAELKSFQNPDSLDNYSQQLDNTIGVEQPVPNFQEETHDRAHARSIIIHDGYRSTTRG